MAGPTPSQLEGSEELYGDTGNDDIYGEDGSDVMAGEQGSDLMSGGGGNDLLEAAYNETENTPDTVNCGSGIGDVTANENDIVASDCENVNLARAIPRHPRPR